MDMQTTKKRLVVGVISTAVDLTQSWLLKKVVQSGRICFVSFANAQ